MPDLHFDIVGVYQGESVWSSTTAIRAASS
jgi:hypothetical protein